MTLTKEAISRSVFDRQKHTFDRSPFLRLDIGPFIAVLVLEPLRSKAEVDTKADTKWHA